MGNDVTAVWIFGLALFFVVVFWAGSSCQLRCPAQGRRDSFEPTLGGVRAPYYALTNYPNPAYTNVTIPLPLPLEQSLRESPGEKNSDCLLTPGGECHLASGGIGICEDSNRGMCLKKKA